MKSTLARIAVIGGLALTLAAQLSFSADNQATGDVAGDSGALVDSNVFQLFSTGNQLALVKRAFLPDPTPSPTPVPTASNLPRGSAVKFVIYVSNDSAAQVNDISLADVLDPAFAYQAGTIRVDNSVAACAPAGCTALEEDAIFTAVNAAPLLTDAVGLGDVASYTGGATRIDIGNATVANAQLDIAPGKVWAVVFTVTLQ